MPIIWLLHSLIHFSYSNINPTALLEEIYLHRTRMIKLTLPMINGNDTSHGHSTQNHWKLTKIFRIIRKYVCCVMSGSYTTDKWRNNWDIHSNGHILIQELPVLYMVLHKINKWHWELKQECKYYTQMQSKSHNGKINFDTKCKALVKSSSSNNTTLPTELIAKAKLTFVIHISGYDIHNYDKIT